MIDVGLSMMRVVVYREKVVCPRVRFYQAWSMTEATAPGALPPPVSDRAQVTRYIFQIRRQAGILSAQARIAVRSK
ncbi:unnamed protein product [Mycena citricolor]|uniref:Uncharacterized protein n=1 Tax=Mycena citricolor TaxID=2018698 RepID=A0AAD2JUY0_9AGAR|nr:unnamed protein product [Mycena citricolor]